MSIDERWYRKPPGVSEHLSAGGVIVRKQGDQLFVALVREGDLPGYVLPKGHVEPGESLEAAAVREIREEAGLPAVTGLGELAVRERLNFPQTSWKRTHYFLYVVDSSGPRGSAEWFPLNALPAMFWPEQRELLETHQQHIADLVARVRSGGRGTDPRREATQHQFRRRAGAYAQSASHRRDRDLDLLIEHLRPRPAERLLDVATGTGFTAVAFRPHVRAVVGVDLTWEMLREAQGLMSARSAIAWAVGDAEALPFADATFDLVTCRRAAHHFTHLERAIEEMLRVLVTSGRLGLADQVPPEEGPGHDLMESLETLRDRSHVRALPASRWQALFAGRGIAVSWAQCVERRLTVADWLQLAGTDVARRRAVETALHRASREALTQIGYEATPTPSFLKRWVVLVGRK